MDLIDSLREIAAKIPTLREKRVIDTEEGTKHALVMPFIAALGYNVFDPTEVRPEFTADVGVKKGEKVDYAIMRDDQPIMLFECKMLGAKFDSERRAGEFATQIYRYFSTRQARFGILTDGIRYFFMTDLVEPNKLDKDPFFVFDLESFKQPDVDRLKQFSKSMFDVTQILSTATELKYRNLIKTYFTNQFENTPSDAFVRLVLQETQAYGEGRVTQQVVNDFRVRTQEALKQVVNEQVDNRLKIALEGVPAPAPLPTTVEPATIEEPAATQAIVTTQDELDAYYIIKSILREVIDVKRITMRDAQSYCSILIDDNNRRPVCRLRFNTAQKYLVIVAPDRSENKVPVNALDDLYAHADALKAIALHYAGTGVKGDAST